MYQLPHVSALLFHPHGVTKTKVYKPTHQDIFCFTLEE